MGVCPGQGRIAVAIATCAIGGIAGDGHRARTFTETSVQPSTKTGPRYLRQ